MIGSGWRVRGVVVALYLVREFPSCRRAQEPVQRRACCERDGPARPRRRALACRALRRLRRSPLRPRRRSLGSSVLRRRQAIPLGTSGSRVRARTSQARGWGGSGTPACESYEERVDDGAAFMRLLRPAYVGWLLDSLPRARCMVGCHSRCAWWHDTRHPALHERSTYADDDEGQDGHGGCKPCD